MILNWIPIEEQLPEAGYMCLVSCCTKKGIKSVNRAYYENGFWHGSGSMSGVEAWMPLPAPYNPTAEQTEPQTDGYISGEDFMKIFDEPQTERSE